MKEITVDYTLTPFLETGRAATYAKRLNWRCEKLLVQNRFAIAGKKVLDLASHDGRFSYACLRLGASHVTGVEARPTLVEAARKNFLRLGMERDSFRFEEADIFHYLKGILPAQYDTILCFGLFYHMTRQAELIEEIIRCVPEYFILDSSLGDVFCDSEGLKFRERLRLWKERLTGFDKKPVLVFLQEDPTQESNTLDSRGLIARPTKAFIELLFNIFKLDYKEIRWRDNGEIKDWSSLKDYEIGKRVSYMVRIRGSALCAE